MRAAYENKSCICGTLIRRGKKIGMIVALYVFMVLLCLLFFGVGIVWELADWIVRRLERMDAYEEKAEKETSG